jgi:hypothetical protein
MAKEYRRRKGSDTWHFCSNCSNWPGVGYERSRSKPRSGELCNECKSKKDRGKCQ